MGTVRNYLVFLLLTIALEQIYPAEGRTKHFFFISINKKSIIIIIILRVDFSPRFFIRVKNESLF